MAYFNHAFHKLFVGTHITQGASCTAKAVDTGFLNSVNVPSVQMINPAAPYSLGVGVYGLFFQDPTLGLVSVNAASGTITTGKPMLLVSSALYQHDKNGPFHGGYQETTKSKLINPRYISRFLRVDPCTPNQNVIHVGNTPFTISGVNLTPALATNSNCCMQFLCGETYFLRVDVKGSPALRTLSRNAYWTMDYETGCCPTGCIAPTPIDSTLAMIGWATQIMNSPIVGPYILPVVYDQLGGAWYSPGSTGEFFQNIPEPGIGTLTTVNSGSGYVDGIFNNVQFGTLDETPSNGSGATATVTVAGGIVTLITIDT